MTTVTHPVFARFTPHPADLTSGFGVDSFLGTRYRVKYDALRTDNGGTCYPPTVNEEYFEWTSLLQSVVESEHDFTFVEAGAGYGRWSIRAAAAARAQGRNLQLVCVEAEPTHFHWLTQTLADNQVDPSNRYLHHAALNSRTGKAKLLKVGSGPWGPDRYWGQAIDQPPPRNQLLARSRHLLRGLKHRALGLGTLTVPAISLDDLLAPFARVDLIDFDIQGAELETIAASRTLKSKAQRLHIETHSRQIEEGLRRLLGQEGWRCEWDFSCNSSASTAYGVIRFQGGVQSWLNPAVKRS